MKRVLPLATLIIASAAFGFQPNSTSPQNPSILFYPSLQEGYELSPFNRPPQNNVLTGNDKSTTTFDQSGYMDTTPVDDTGTEKDIYHKLQPNWVVPIPY
ncbi:Uncharacterised protein [Legionella lansingensis]|uniref:Uncharacterized protein n=1 Tax=Legionella lansingensis TaxID=45067 RepID=A0A0W0VL54_9GAMM|nr:hypothetical protein [Legionella lansingensis]KTD20803.1 hypothetical protein Llan_1760 [Legionella lansingensis]SNV49857.1 Uncharacterised protein [Legionella lansingensis]